MSASTTSDAGLGHRPPAILMRPLQCLRAAVCLLVAATLVGCASSDEPSPEFRELGIATLIEDATRADGFRLVAGNAADSADSEDNALIVAVLQPLGKKWSVHLVARSLNTGGAQGCAAEVSDDLVPGGQSMVVRCFSGGTNRVGYVRVFGVDPVTGAATVFTTVSCGVTHPIVVGDTLRLESTGEQANASTPGAPQPDQTLSWDGSGFVPADDESFDQFCSDGVFGP